MDVWLRHPCHHCSIRGTLYMQLSASTTPTPYTPHLHAPTCPTHTHTGTYSFKRYKQQPQPSSPEEQPSAPPQLVCPLHQLAQAAGSTAAAAAAAARSEALALAQAYFWARDMVNTPANDLGPAELAAEALALARHHGAQVGRAAPLCPVLRLGALYSRWGATSWWGCHAA